MENWRVYSLTIMVPDPKYVLELAQALVDARSNLAELQAKWDALFASPPAEAPNKGGRKLDPDGNSARVLAAINSAANEIWSADRVEQHTGLTRKQVEKALYNLCAAGKINRVERGKYGAASLLQELTSMPRLALN